MHSLREPSVLRTEHIGAAYGEQDCIMTFCSTSLLISLFTSALQAMGTRRDLIIGVSSTNGMRCVTVVERPSFPGPAKTLRCLFSNFNSLAFWSAVSWLSTVTWLTGFSRFDITFIGSVTLLTRTSPSDISVKFS